MSTITIELRPHVGQQRTALGPVNVEFAQRLIFATGENGQTLQVGLVGTQPGAPINFLRQPNGQEWPPAVKDLVRQAVARELGAGVRREGQPPLPPHLRTDPVDTEIDDEDLGDD